MIRRISQNSFFLLQSWLEHRPDANIIAFNIDIAGIFDIDIAGRVA